MMAERRVERFVKKVSKKEGEETKGSVRSSISEPDDNKSSKSIKSSSEAGKLEVNEIVEAINESQQPNP